MIDTTTYQQFLESKIDVVNGTGFEIDLLERAA